VAVLPLAVLAASMLISYERAKAESLGFDARGGLMERAERLVALAVGLLFDSVLVPILWIMLVLTLFTAGQRFVSVWRQASAPPPSRPEGGRWRTRRVARSTRQVWRRRGPVLSRRGERSSGDSRRSRR
jgi:CDP-diacylglycerol--glycerol-3-phosphate 3-phosphatidyltransferase